MDDTLTLVRVSRLLRRRQYDHRLTEQEREMLLDLLEAGGGYQPDGYLVEAVMLARAVADE